MTMPKPSLFCFYLGFLSSKYQKRKHLPIFYNDKKVLINSLSRSTDSLEHVVAAFDPATNEVLEVVIVSNGLSCCEVLLPAS
jgi:hypothetical protein